MKLRHALLLILLLLPLALGGCGNKGPLYLPEPEKKTD
jgi:predicted small lipoprotein YifL